MSQIFELSVTNIWLVKIININAKINGRDYESMKISATGGRILYWVKDVLVLKINLNDFSTVMQVLSV
jgi:hypothetical protein